MEDHRFFSCTGNSINIFQCSIVDQFVQNKSCFGIHCMLLCKNTRGSISFSKWQDFYNNPSFKKKIKMSSQHIQKNFPGLLHTTAKYEKNLPYGWEAIAKRKWGSVSRFSHTNKRPLWDA